MYTLKDLNNDLEFFHDGFYVACESLCHSGYDLYNSCGDFISSYGSPLEIYYDLCTYGLPNNLSNI